MNPLKCPKCQSDNPADTRFCGNCAAPLEGETPLSIVMKHKGETPKDPRELNAQVPQDQSRVILRCLEKEKAKRYQSADELHTDLEKIEKGIPTTERVPMRKPLTSREITVKFSLR